MKKRLIIAAILAFVLSGCQTAEVTESTSEELPVPGSELPEGNLPSQVTPSPVLEEIPVSVQPVEEHIFSTEETIPAETEEPVLLLEDEPSDRGNGPPMNRCWRLITRHGRVTVGLPGMMTAA